jgi:hypothetical protein
MSLKALAVALWCTGILAAEARADDSIEDFGPRRELAGHVFFPSLVVTDPFVSTYFSAFTAAGYDWIEGPSFDIRGNTIGRRSYRAAAMAQGATFQAGLTDFLAIRITGGGGVDGGASARSAVVIGAIIPITVGAGATLSWRVAPKVRFGLTADFVYAHSRLIQPLNAIRGSILAGEVTLSGVTDKLNSETVTPGGTLAIAPCDAVGLLAFATYSWTRQTDGDTRHFNYVDVGASAQVDLLPNLALPVGLLASYRANIPFEDEIRFVNIVEGGLFYTGRKDLDLGLEAQVKWYDLRPDHIFRLDTTEAIGAIEMRYHWN